MNTGARFDGRAKSCRTDSPKSGCGQNALANRWDCHRGTERTEKEWNETGKVRCDGYGTGTTRYWDCGSRNKLARSGKSTHVAGRFSDRLDVHKRASLLREPQSQYRVVPVP